MAERFDNLKKKGENLQRTIRRIGVDKVKNNTRFTDLRKRKEKHDAQVQKQVEELLKERESERKKEREREDEKLRLQNAPTKDAPKVSSIMNIYSPVKNVLRVFASKISETIKDTWFRTDVDRHIERIKKEMNGQRKEGKPGTSPHATGAENLNAIVRVKSI